jgi:uncharacterized protein (DUF2252 family)
MAAGKALRDKLQRDVHATRTPALTRRDPVQLLKQEARGRVPALLPIRYGRMRASPFAFLRGSAAVMAADLAETPVTGVYVQACGDCHISNFGGYASPERRLIFDINDFDETLPAPWEWDIKRLATSVLVASRELGARDRKCADATREVVKSYREHMREYARMSALEVWYSSLDAEILITEAADREEKRRWEAIEGEARSRTSEHVFPKITAVSEGEPRIIDDPPFVYHPANYGTRQKFVIDMFDRYRRTVPEERRVILDRYRLVDVARKVVGVGSVGTRCAVILLMAAKKDPLFLQFKESRASVLEPYAGKSRYTNQGERVVAGQRMLQSSSDVFLGWTQDDDGLQYYFRQFQDMKMKIEFAARQWEDWIEYIVVCGWALARAHARTGDPAVIAGYLGRSDAFDTAIEKFASAYADQNERDYEALLRAIRAGRLRATAPADASPS